MIGLIYLRNENDNMNNKKGYMQDFLFFGLIVLILSIIIVSGGKIYGDYNDKYQDSNAGDFSKNLQDNAQGRYNVVFDYVFMFVFIVFGLSIIVSMFMLDTHPVLFVALIIIFSIILIVMGILGNAFDRFKANDDMASTAASMPVMAWLMSHILEATLVFGFIGLVVLFAKFREY